MTTSKRNNHEYNRGTLRLKTSTLSPLEPEAVKLGRDQKTYTPTISGLNLLIPGNWYEVGLLARLLIRERKGAQ